MRSSSVINKSPIRRGRTNLVSYNNGESMSHVCITTALKFELLKSSMECLQMHLFTKTFLNAFSSEIRFDN